MDPTDQDFYQQALYSQQLYTRSPYKDRHYALPHHPQHAPFYSEMTYPPYVVSHQQAIDDYYAPYSADYDDLMYPGMVHDGYGGEVDEISTRPRLTKEQVEVLEAQFQANHKPNSQAKRQLAVQTKLTLPRVANWFQNRRAKAKQQKKQEEFEAQNAAASGDSNGPASLQSASAGPSSPTKSIPSPTKSIPSPTKFSNSSRYESSSPTRARDGSKEASWLSLQRALNSAKAAQAERQEQPPQTPKATMPPPEVPLQTSTIKLPLRTTQSGSPSRMALGESWIGQQASAEPYPSPITLQDHSFDFGFDNDTFTTQPAEQTDASIDYSSQAFVVTPEEWEEPLATPTNTMAQSDSTVLLSPGLPMPAYPGSRRTSTTDDLSHNFGNFALAGSSPNVLVSRRQSETIRAPDNGSLDIAARRKRPRPAPLTSTSLRSRSYGAMTSVSPTFRHGNMTPQAHTVRHVKSAGHSLNSRFAGVRKASSAQRSPICVAFAETEAFNQLMAQQALVAQSLADLPQPMLSPGLVGAGQVHEPEKNHFFPQNMDISHHYHQQPLHLTTATPPITPMAAEFMARGLSQASLIPPSSAPPQFASFPDYTPPYSAGPLTNSSWPDAPLTSPDVTAFPPGPYMPSMGYPTRTDTMGSNFQQFVLPSDTKTNVSIDLDRDQTKTEFYIQEFPNQKQEHAHVAQQLAQQKPKSYVFANYAPQDYD